VDISLLIIGSQLLTGARKDQHTDHAIEVLGRHGLNLASSHVVASDPARITRCLGLSLASGDTVFVFGGLGYTPSDHTRACAAAAAGIPLVRHPETAAAIEAQFGAEAYPHRIHLADFPEGATLIPNPLNRFPGFSLSQHHFLPGFREMAWPMMDWVLSHRFQELRRTPQVEHLVRVRRAREHDLMDLMERFVRRFPEVGFSSLPHLAESSSDLELGIRGDEPAARSSLQWLTGELNVRGFGWETRRREAA
jgi:molybdopterin-biosynthesis enzyme MoeA-like protein